MREIKFRAWNDNRMFYSDSQKDAEMIGARVGDSCIAKFFERFYGLELMQYTTRKDCKRTEEYPKGQEIYAGDIVRFKDFHDEITAEVKWNKGGYWDYLPKGWKVGGYSAHLCAGVEVIGNIYENPGLI